MGLSNSLDLRGEGSKDQFKTLLPDVTRVDGFVWGAYRE